MPNKLFDQHSLPIDVVQNGDAAGGDLSGTYPSPTVVGLESIPIESGAPINGDVLMYNDAPAPPGSPPVWEHAQVVFGGGPPNGPAGGSLAGLYPNPTLSLVGAPGTYGDANHIPVITTDAEGRVSNVTLVSVYDAMTVYGEFSDSTDQPITNVPSVVTFNRTESANGVFLAAGSRLTVSIDGTYAFNISPQLYHSGGGTQTIFFWARINGSDVPRSASSFEMGNNNNRTLPYLELTVSMLAGQFLEWVFVADPGTNLTLEAFPAMVSPPDAYNRPANPSIIAGVKRIGA